MERAIVKREIEGEVVFHRSERDECKCCDGNHVYGRTIIVEQRPSIYPGLQMDSVRDFINECLVTIPEIEGKKVRISIEVIQ